MKLTNFARLALLTGCICITSCSSGDENEPEHLGQVIEHFTPEPMIFTDSAGEQTFSFTANAAWTASVATTRSGGNSWCTIAPTSGSAGNHTVKVTTTSNDSYDDRSVTLTLKVGNESKSFIVTQKQKNALLLTSDKFEIGQKGGRVTVEVKSNVDYAGIIGEDCKNWISEDCNSRALSTKTKHYVISVNENLEKREGTITFSDGTLTETVHIYQAGGPLILLSKNECYVSASGEELVIELKSNCEYEVQMPSVNWIKENVTRSMSSHTLYYTIDANETYDNREAKIVYKDKKNESIADTLTIRQAQKDAIIISEKDVKVGSESSTIEVKIDANVEFEMQLPQVDWISEIESRALTTHKKYLRIAENIGETAREAKIIFKNTTSGIEETLTVCQSAKGNRMKIHVEKPGTLSDHIPESEKLEIAELVVSGNLGGQDIALIREMAGRDRENNRQTNGKLVYLDMTDATIVADGEYYLRFTSSGEVYTPIENAIGERMFNGCFLQTVLLPKSITAIEGWAFFLCDNLAKVEIPNSVKTIGESAFQDCNLSKIILPEGLRIIQNNAFTGCKNLSDITLPEGVDSIGSYAFFHCPIRSIVIPKSVKSMGSCVFDSDGLDITIPGHLLGRFSNPIVFSCKDLHVQIAEGSIAVEEGAFFKYSGLVSIVLPESIVSIKSEAFSGCSSLSQIVIPDKVEILGASAFRDCEKLTEMALPDGLKFIGQSAFWGCSLLSKVNIPQNITKISESLFYGCTNLGKMELPDNITTIGKMAFEECSNLTMVVPESVESIDYCAFRNIANLSITLPGRLLQNSGHSLFPGCKNLKIALTEGTTSLGEHALSDCEGLVEIDIPNSVTSIGDGAFYRCTGLKDINIPNSVSSIKQSAFKECTSLNKITIPHKISTIESYTFQGCIGLTEIIISDKVNIIGDGAFSGCTALENITFPSKLTRIKDRAFSGCIGLTKIVIPEGVTTLEGFTFLNCTGLKSVVIPHSVTSIISSPFKGCSNLSDMKVPDRLYSTDIFSGTGITDVVIPMGVTTVGNFDGCSKLVNITIPEGVKSLGVFWDCTSLIGIELPESITAIKETAFMNCTALRKVVMPNTITSIETLTFKDCSSLTELLIPDSVVKIGESAFSNCTSLSSVTLGSGLQLIEGSAFSKAPITQLHCRSIAPPRLISTNSDLFDFYGIFYVGFTRKNSTLYVPQGSGTSYAESSWKEFFENIVEVQ